MAGVSGGRRSSPATSHLWRAIKHVRLLASGGGGPAAFRPRRGLSLFSFNGHFTASANMSFDNDNDMPSRPSTPPNPVPSGYFSASFERLIRENEMAELASAFTLFGERCRILISCKGTLILRA